MRYLIRAAILGMMFQSGLAFAQESEPKVGQKFGDWVFQCSAIGQNRTDCAFVQTIVTPDRKRQLAQVQILEQEAEPGSFILTFVLPLGVDIQNGVTARADETAPVSATFRTCLPRGCIASLPLDANLAGALRAANRLELSFTMADGKQTATVVGSLKGIDEAFTAAEWF